MAVDDIMCIISAISTLFIAETIPTTYLNCLIVDYSINSEQIYQYRISGLQYAHADTRDDAHADSEMVHRQKVKH